MPDQLSCCAPDGAWFMKCGSARNAYADHTWTEGVLACRDFAGWLLEAQARLYREKAQAHPNATRQRNDTLQHIGRSGDGYTDCEDCHSLAKIILSISFVCVVL